MTETPDGYQMCPDCGHHTSAYTGGCTVFVERNGQLGYCGCDCVVAMGGESLHDRMARLLWGDNNGNDAR